MAKTLQDFLLEVEKEYKYKVKFACEIDNEHMDKIEKVLKKYEVVDVSGPSKSIIQKQPLDFPQLSNVEIYTVEVTTKYPMSLDQAKQEIRYWLGIEDKFVIVRPEDSPYETYNEQIVSRRDDDYDTKLTDPLHKKDGTKHKPEDYYGDEYNKEMVNTIKGESKKGDEVDIFTESLNESGQTGIYQGREVPLRKPMSGDVKKYMVYVNSGDKVEHDGRQRIRAQKVNFGDKDMTIKRDDPEARKNFRARHKCADQKDEKTAAYWSCKFWGDTPVSELLS